MHPPAQELTAGLALAERGGYPQVGGAGVKEHQEVLRGGPDADLPIIRHLEEKGRFLLRGTPQVCILRLSPCSTGLQVSWGCRVCHFLLSLYNSAVHCALSMALLSAASPTSTGTVQQLCLQAAQRHVDPSCSATVSVFPKQSTQLSSSIGTHTNSPLFLHGHENSS